MAQIRRLFNERLVTVSVIINAFAEKPSQVREAIRSVLDQTVSPCEIILVEDGGPQDFTQLTNDYPSIERVRRANGGLAAARNTGLFRATGDFILFLDGDDRLLPHAIETNLRALEQDRAAAFSFGGWRYIDDTGTPSFQARMMPMEADPYLSFLKGNCIGMHATVLYRRKALIEAGGFDEHLRACEDYELYLRLTRSNPLCFAGGLLAEYRRHDENMSNHHRKMLDFVERVLTMQYEYISSRPDLRKACRQGLRNWREHYARQQLSDIATASTKASKAAAIWEAAWLARIPFATAKLIMLEGLRRLRNRIVRSEINWGDLRRTTPVSKWFGFDRGRPVDRYYIENFLERNASEIRGRVLEIGDDAYTRQFGRQQVIAAEVLHIDATAAATYHGDLADGAGIPDCAFDCVVLTQTLHLIYDFAAAVRTLERILKPGGVLLLTVPGISSVDRGEWGKDWYWSFTQPSLARALGDVFGSPAVHLESYGNVMAATAFLYGLADNELEARELDAIDVCYPVIIAARVRKSGSEADLG
jgi:glycosyltransferase involved in cell wall biosynthesis